MVEISLLRLSHRKERDKRITTHLFLTARVLGVRNVWYGGERDEKIEKSIKNIEEKWGKVFNEIKYIKNVEKFLREIKNKYILVHLTMYGVNYKETLSVLKEKIKSIEGEAKQGICIIVGSEKVPGFVYEIADYNVAIGAQPHSEVTAFVIFMYELNGCKLNEKYEDPKLKIIPMKKGKRVVEYGVEKE